MSYPILVPINLTYLLAHHIKLVEDCYDFCYPEGTLNSGRVHPSLLKLGRISNNLFKILSQMKINSTDSNEIKNPLIEYGLDLCDAITKQKNYAYPNNSFNEASSHLVLSKIKMIINGFANAQPLFSYVLKDNNSFGFPSIDLNNLFNIVNFTTSYHYAYPENNGKRLYSEGNCHGAFQMLFGDNLCFLTLLSSIPNTSINDLDKSLQNALEVTSSSFKAAHKILIDAYPNSQLDISNGHKNLSLYLKLYRTTKEIFLAKLQMYQDINQFSESPKVDLHSFLSTSEGLDINKDIETSKKEEEVEITPRSKLSQKVSNLL